MGALELVASWDVPNAAAAIVASDGSVAATHGEVERVFRLASVTKVAFGWGAMVAVEEGVLALDDPVGQPGCTLRHLLAHAGGYPFDGERPVASAGSRRIYSNSGIELAAGELEARSAMTVGDYLSEAVLRPLAMTSARLFGSPAHGLVASVNDVAKLLTELQRPQLLSAAGAAAAVTIQFPELAGIVPGVGRFDPCPWGLGIEIRGDKSPHWTGTANSPQTFGHFGGAGTMMWVDPVAGCALVALADRSFDEWPDAVGSWSALSDAVVAEWDGGRVSDASGLDA